MKDSENGWKQKPGDTDIRHRIPDLDKGEFVKDQNIDT